MKQHKTSSFRIDAQGSSFKSLTKRYSISQYTLPAHLKFKRNYFGVLHNWAKSNIDNPYYLHFATKKLYVLYIKEANPEILTFEDKVLPVEHFERYKDAKLTHIWLKVLLAQFIELNSSFISNDTFYIHSELNKTQTWATVLKISLQHDFKYREGLVFNIIDSAIRLKKISLSEYNQYHKRDIPYGLSFKKGSVIFKQLKRNELKEYDANIFVKPKPLTGNRSKSSISFHSIMDEVHHEKSKSFIIQNFLAQFAEFLSKYDIAISVKELNLERIDKKSETEALRLRDYKISLIDGRINKDLPLKDAIIIPDAVQNEITIVEKTTGELSPNESVLFVMDYSKEDFAEYYPNKVDPYLEFKKSKSYSNIAKQGICVNELSFTNEVSLPEQNYFNYSGLGEKDLERNLSICVNQLILKSILLSGDCNHLPRIDLLKNKLFVYRNKVMYIAQDKLIITEIHSFDLFDKLSKQVTERSDIFDVLYKLNEYHNPFAKGESEFDMSRFRLIISKDSVLELIDYPERAFYDDNEIQNRIKNRTRKRSIDEFEAKETSELAVIYNEYLDNNVEELSLSYEELITKYGKGEEGFLKTIFYEHQDRKTYADTIFRKFLGKNKGIIIQGLKEDGIFATHSGIWFDKEQMQYFVGRTHGYGKHKQDKGFQMKKIVIHSGQFFEDTFFPLLNIDFIRFKELTVNPYPFKLIDMIIEIELNGEH